jgi:hypothetical protein
MKKWRVTWQAPAHPKPRSEDFEEEHQAQRAVEQLLIDGKRKSVRWTVEPNKKELEP